MPERIQLSRRKGWRLPPDTVVVTRSSRWGNPWIVGRPGFFWLPDLPASRLRLAIEITADDAVTLYGHLLRGGPDPVAAALPADLTAHGRLRVRDMLRSHATQLRNGLHLLRGRNLACWCPPLGKDGHPSPCHADVLLEIANG